MSKVFVTIHEEVEVQDAPTKHWYEEIKKVDGVIFVWSEGKWITEQQYITLETA